MRAVVPRPVKVEGHQEPAFVAPLIRLMTVLDTRPPALAPAIVTVFGMRTLRLAHDRGIMRRVPPVAIEIDGNEIGTMRTPGRARLVAANPCPFDAHPKLPPPSAKTGVRATSLPDNGGVVSRKGPSRIEVQAPQELARRAPWVTCLVAVETDAPGAVNVLPSALGVAWRRRESEN